VLGDLEEPDIDPDAAWVFVPIRPVLGPGEQPFAELRRLADGRRALPVYTSPAALVEACGARQHWVGFPAEQLPRVEVDGGYDTVVLDLRLPPQPRTTPGGLA
jgi:hypothetical protein